MHSTTTTMTEIAANIAIGLNQQLPTQRYIVAVSDLSKTFDTMDHAQLIVISWGRHYLEIDV